ncbi:strictosidine synthase-like [Hibiscus syriacus]|uniref:strictosidine synthase-like n=1 Tax=Hibiscus syriacus TaxID=106335 RepID=UPI0019208BBA|nr:strictosidine synthase-like [Hibiscus syriacus]
MPHLNPSCGRVLGPKSGLATILSTVAYGETYRFCDGVDVHQPTRNVCFTDVSVVYDIKQFETTTNVKDSTGRLLKCDVGNNEVTVLLRNLSFPGGVAVDDDEEFVLVSEFIGNRTQKIQVQGRNPYESGIVNTRPIPDNIKKVRSYGFWIAATRIY